jgi:hypothetical protein
VVRDWESAVRNGLGGSYSSAHPDVVCELADHLEEFYEDLTRRGESPHEAERKALAQVTDWIRLRKRLERTREGDSMRNQQIRAVWFPGLLTTIVAFGLLRVILAFGALPWWILQGRASSLLHLPPLQTETWLFVLPWLAALPLAGATGAFASWRASGRSAQRVLAALFPALVIAGLVALNVVTELIIALAPGRPESQPLTVRLLVFTIPWVWLPVLSLLLGSLPFLRLRTPSLQTA